jgi:pimeloyl-ACP methyl ester carboxylesterase
MRYVSLIIFILLGAVPSFSQAGPNTNLEGNWLGTLDVGGIKLRLVVKVTKTTEGYSAKLDSIDQGAKDIAIDSIKIADRKVVFSASAAGLIYEGLLNEAGDSIVGLLKQGGASIHLLFRHVASVPDNKRPQDPVKPYPYVEEEVYYRNTKDNLKLAGTLTVPRGNAKYPAVVLISGSGSQDRDGTMAGHRLFLVIADHLTKHGIAVLRVDDRGVGGSDLGSPRATTDDLVDDVLAAVEYLRTRKDIDPKKIGLVGHSEGGVIAPIAATRSRDVSFIVMLAGSAQVGTDIILTQLAMLRKADGARPDAIKDAVDFQKALLSIITTEPDDGVAAKKINTMMAERKAKMNEQQQAEFKELESAVRTQLPLLLSPWYRYFLSYDPRPTLEKVRVPVLALNGESDLQVSARENLAIISEAFRTGGNKDVTVKSLPKLNHLFQTSTTGAISEYSTLDETISPQVLEMMSAWILEKTKAL